MDNINNDKPLVSFLVFAYNQEKYISDAVKGALSQTYSPMEIIISDDCSSDSTFSIIEETVANYKGPNKIKLNRNESNLGLSRHVNKVMSMAKGSIFVLAAGDDISFSTRVETIVGIWKNNPNITAMCSGYTMIDENNNEIGTRCLSPDGLSLAGKYEDIKNSIWAGCSVAISAELYRYFGDIKYKDSTDDRVLFRRSVLLGNIYRIKEPLLYYRIGGISGNTTDIFKKIRLLTLHFYGLKNFLFDVKKVTNTPETEKCKNYIYRRCWIVFTQLKILKLLAVLDMNPYPILDKLKKCLRPVYRKYFKELIGR